VAWGLALAAFVLATRLPFLWSGYGTDTDTWKFAEAIHAIATTGVYTASRMPGYPLMELACAPLEHLGPWASNLLSAVAAAACAWLLSRLFMRHASGGSQRDAWLAGAAFTFVPAAYIASTSSIDYLWSIAFLLAAWLDAEEGRVLRAALLLGCAVGARLTSCLFVLPLGWLLWRHAPAGSLTRALRFAVIAGVLGALWYVPGYLRYGNTLLSYSEPGRGQASALRFVEGLLDPSAAGIALPLVAGQATVLLWGLLGCTAIAVALVSLLLWRAPRSERAVTLPRAVAVAMAVAVALELLLYVRLPHDEGYLLPAVPFVILALAASLPRLRFRAVAALLLLSPFVLGVDVSPPKKGLTPATPSAFAVRLPVARETVVIEPFRGPLLRDLAKRERIDEVLDALAAWWPQRPAEFRLLAGNLDPMLFVRFPIDPHIAPWEKSYPPDARARFRAAGVPMFVLPDVVPRLRIEEGALETGAFLPLAGAERDLP
jgi:hypothetical protein